MLVSASASAGPAPVPMGYGVVDPMPSPASCGTLRYALYPTGIWQAGTIDFTLTMDDYSVDGNARIGGPLTVVNGTSHVITGGINQRAVHMLITPDPGAGILDVSMVIKCQGVPDEPAIWQFNLGAQPLSGGAYLIATVVDHPTPQRPPDPPPRDPPPMTIPELTPIPGSPK